MAGFWQTAPSALLALLTLVQCTATEAPREQAQTQARIQLMTSLPLVWGDGASMESILAGSSEPAPIYRYWQEHYDLAAVDSLENLAADDPDIVLLAQPRAMAPADLADLDAWVRAGGTVIILTDPQLVWPSALPFGDPRRPLAVGLLSPLLDHWGLELVAVADTSAATAERQVGNFQFTTRGVGRFERLSSEQIEDVRCTIATSGFLAECSIGKGRAAIVADADFLNAAFWQEEARQAPRKSGAAQFIDSLVRDHFAAAGRQK